MPKTGQETVNFIAEGGNEKKENRLKTAKLFREHWERGGSPAIVMKNYMHATLCSSLV